MAKSVCTASPIVSSHLGASFLLRDHVDLTDFGKGFIEWRRQFAPYNEPWGG